MSSSRILNFILVVAILIIGANMVYAANFTEPAGPPPGNNTDEPLNRGIVGQIKLGGLTLNAGTPAAVNGLIVSAGNVGIGDTTPDSGTGGQLKVDVEGNVGATKYCDQAGNNCYTSTELYNGSGGSGSTYVKSLVGSSVNVYCNQGDQATGGGSRNTNQGDTHSSYPIKAGAAIPANGEVATGWHCLTENSDNCFVVCLDTNTAPSQAPTVDINANPTTVSNCGSFLQPQCQSTLTWTSTNADTCTASGSWSGTKAPSGTETRNWTGTATQTFTLTCTGSGTASDNAVVTHL